eukprot:scaffold4219_cov142-Skeletonema_menzelii.AAC.8
MSSLDMTIVPQGAFAEHPNIIEVICHESVEQINGAAFAESECPSLRRVIMPRVNLVEGEVHAIIAALHLEEWRNDMKQEIDSINQILSNTPAGDHDDDIGEKAQAIRTWIRSVLGKIDHYKAEHQSLMNEATTLLELALWKVNLDDNNGGRSVREGVRTTRGSLKRARRELCVTSGASIVIKNVLPFLQLKS